MTVHKNKPYRISIIAKVNYRRILRMQNQNDTFLFMSKRGENQGKQSKCAQKWPQDGPERPKPFLNGAPRPSQIRFSSTFWFCFWSQICIFVLQFCRRMCLFFEEPTFKIHAPTQCFVDFHTFGHISKKISKIVEKSSRNPPQIE